MNFYIYVIDYFFKNLEIGLYSAIVTADTMIPFTMLNGTILKSTNINGVPANEFTFANYFVKSTKLIPYNGKITK